MRAFHLETSFIALAYCASALSSNGAFAISPQLGPYPVSISDFALQTDRDDILSPQSGIKRRLMLSIFSPQMHSFECFNTTYISYMPIRTARVMEKEEPAGIPLSGVDGLDFNGLDVRYCSVPSELTPSLGGYVEPSPIVLFQPGYQGSRYSHQISLASIASSGYIVISMDITYECPMIEFPDGSIMINNTGFSDGGLGPNECLPVRADDFSSVVDALKNGTLQIPGLEPSQMGQAKIGVFGHSIGGAAAVLAASKDSRIDAAIDWDGQFFLAQRNITVSTPTLLFQRETTLEGHLEDWQHAWDNLLRGSKAWIAVNGTQHLSFTDLPIVVDVERLDAENREILRAIGGVISATRMREVVWRFSVGWFDYILKRRKSGLFQDRNDDFADVRFMGSSSV